MAFYHTFYGFFCTFMAFELFMAFCTFVIFELIYTILNVLGGAMNFIPDLLATCGFGVWT